MAEELSKRDRDIIDTVADLGFVRSTQLEQLHFADLSDSSRARRRRAVLSRLSAQQFIEPLQRRIGGHRSGSAGYIYRLGVAGQRLRQLQASETGRLRREAQPSLQFLRHHLAVADVYVELRTARFDQLLALEVEPACWRTIDSLAPETLKPDLYVEYQRGDLIHAWFVEVDLNTERTPALKAKADRYERALRQGLRHRPSDHFPRVLWIVEEEQRAETVRGALDGGTEGLHEVRESATGAMDLLGQGRP